MKTTVLNASAAWFFGVAISWGLIWYAGGWKAGLLCLLLFCASHNFGASCQAEKIEPEVQRRTLEEIGTFNARVEEILKSGARLRGLGTN